MADLIIRDGSGQTRILPITKPKIKIGKRPDNDIVVDHVESSRYHCEVDILGPDFVLRDLDSTNGTRIGGERIKGPVALKNGMAFSIGSCTISLRTKGDAGVTLVDVDEARRKAVRARLKENLNGMELVGKSLMSYLERARGSKASDLHLTVGSPPFMRVNGQVVSMEHPAVTNGEMDKWMKELLRSEQLLEFQRKPDIDMSWQTEQVGRFRVNVHKQAHGNGMNFRLVPEKIPTLEELGLPDVLRQFTQYHQGIVFLTGPGGCGKSSTLAALVEIINTEKKRQIITIEDPIEFSYQSRMSTVIQRQVKIHTHSWGNALRSALREDPDVIVVGELRDLEAISVAISAAETGHLVLTTLPTCGAIKTIDRILDSYPHVEQARIRVMISESLRGVVSQHLIPNLEGTGMSVAVEILFTTPAVSNLIREAKTYQILSVIQTGKRHGMTTMDDSLAELVQQGKITTEDAMVRAEDIKRFQTLE